MKEPAMSHETAIMGIFDDEDSAVRALIALRKTSWPLKKVESPIPSQKITEILSLKKSKVGYFTLAGGIIGFFAGFMLAAVTASQWHLIVGGKPVVALVPFFIVGFEFTILFAVFGNVAGLIHQMKLPDYSGLVQHDPRCSEDRFGILSSCPPDEEEELAGFFRKHGGETTIFS